MALIDEMIHYSILHIILMIKKMCYLSIRPLLKALDNFEHHHSIPRKKLTYSKKKNDRNPSTRSLFVILSPNCWIFFKFKGTAHDLGPRAARMRRGFGGS